MIRCYLTAFKALTLSLVLALSAAAQVDLDEFNEGLVAGYHDTAGHQCLRVDRTIAFAWGDRAPDERLDANAFTVNWNGYLMSQTTGEYRLYAYVDGRVSVRLKEQVVLAGQTSEPAWIASQPIPLAFDWHSLQVAFEKTNKSARIALYWSGPRFQLEPIGARFFYRDPDSVPADSFARGRDLVRTLRCAACHQDIEESTPLAAPALKQLAGHINPKWLVDWLMANTAAQDHGELARRMPAFGLDRAQATRIAACLLAGEGDSNAATDPLPSKATRKSKPLVPDPREGKRLFLSLGCLACHSIGDLGTVGLYGGGELTRVADKRPAEFFRSWLKDPAKLNADHRMPIFELSTEEREHLGAYLSEQKSAAKTRGQELERTETTSLVVEGRKLIAELRCNACHRLREPPAPAARIRIDWSSSTSWDRACTGAPDRVNQRPGFTLSDTDTASIREYLGLRRTVNASLALDGQRLVAENGCLGCHARDEVQGLTSLLPSVADAEGSLAEVLAGLAPPPLHSVGDKLYDHALEAAVGGKAGVRRPWLLVRMPKFRLDEEQVAAIVQFFTDTDRIPDGGPRTSLPIEAAGSAEPVVRLAGARLVTSDGFGCTSCHAVGDVVPPQAPLNTKGPDLLSLGKRIRPAWFDRWVRNPARIIPRMEMPSVQLAVRGVLNDDLDSQLTAVWGVLNEPDFRPPEPGPLRIARRSAIAERGERALVLTDVLHVDGAVLIKPFLIGLPNRHNALLDLEQGRMIGWWIGDAAWQRTRGKTWYWQTVAPNLLDPTDFAEVSLVRDGVVNRSQPTGQFVTEADAWEHRDGGIVLEHRLRLSPENESASPGMIPLRIKQTFLPDWNAEDRSSTGGLMRKLEIAGGRAGDHVQFRAAMAGDENVAHIEQHGPVELDSWIEDGCRVYDFAWPAQAQQLEFSLHYTSQLPVDSFPVIPPESIAGPVTPLNVVPGFQSDRLGLPDEIMPTGFSWQSDGSLVVTSLKGRVWQCRDTDGDQLEDALSPISDELAAPFGAATASGYVDVINKFALLRLIDRDGDGMVDRTETLTSGWGHTQDYHDWAIGLPSDGQGGYYVATACQQDQRGEAAARMRGEVLRLEPRRPTPNDPHRFTIARISGGHRFPVGIARNKEGQVFVPDNQGNYNPFNELNHVRPGKRFGFINAIERKLQGKDFNPDLTEPAIDIPHPWTRSVNGITFLETPAELRKQTGDYFGPFEGHLIGCEYDTRRLIRMSLQRIGDTYQGAAYPLSDEPFVGGETFLGPLCAAVAPDGDVYIGCIRDSGWGGANNIGAITRMRIEPEAIPAGIAEVRAIPGGFEVRMTRPLDPLRLGNPACYSVASYTRRSTPAYGGEDVERRVDKITAIEAGPDGTRVRLQLEQLRPGFVYELRLKDLTADNEPFFPAEAFYTLRQLVD